MLAPVLAHIAGMPVEETLLSVGPALVAAVSVGLVHIRSLRDRASSPDAEPPCSGHDGDTDGEGHDAADPGIPSATGLTSGPRPATAAARR